MKIKGKSIVIISVVVGLFLGWYLLIKESDYCISFKVKTATGTIFQGIDEWSTARSKSSNEKYATVEKRNFDYLRQEMTDGNRKIEYAWDIVSVNDSVSKVNVSIKEFNHSLYNKLTVPFFTTKFKSEQIEKIKGLKEGIEAHIKNFKVKIDGDGTSEEAFVAYINLKSVLQEKAQTMIGNDAEITGFLQQNHIKIVGMPYLEIVNWNLDKEMIDFNYCFPIEKKTALIENDLVKFKTISAKKGLQATYYGNFRTSDRAWFALLDYAKRHGLRLNNKPLEHFLANPFNGGNELEWETKIIIPFE